MSASHGTTRPRVAPVRGPVAGKFPRFISGAALTQGNPLLLNETTGGSFGCPGYPPYRPDVIDLYRGRTWMPAPWWRARGTCQRDACSCLRR